MIHMFAFSQFPDGILFPDTIEVNFSVTVDPNSRRKPEDNDNLKSVIKVNKGVFFMMLF